MNESLSPTLLRLREADIVRLCGFEAATRGLDLAGRQALTQMRRVGARLEASVTDERPIVVAAEFMTETPDAVSHPALRWNCSAHTNAGAASPDGRGCEHVAALLTAWMRARGDFLVVTPDAPPSAPHPLEPARATKSTAPRQTPPRSRPQPATSATGAALADELARLSARDLLAIARRTLGADLTESEARARLATALSDPSQVQTLLERLDARLHWLFGALLVLGGAITTKDLDGLAERSGRAPSAMQADAEGLARHGLLFAAISANDWRIAEARSWRALAGWRIAPETRAAAAHLATLDTLLGDGASPAATPSVAGKRLERASPRDILLALALLARAPPPLGPFGRHEPSSPAPPRDSHAQGLHVAGDLAPGRLTEFARSAGMEAGLARMMRRILLWAREQAPGQPLLDLTRLSHDERARALRQAFDIWRDTDSLAELVDLDLADSAVRARLDTQHPAYSPTMVAAEVGAARRFLLALLARAQPGVWYALDDVLTFVWRLQPGFLRGRQRAFTRPIWLLERTEGGRRPLHMNQRDEWLAAEGVWIRSLLLGPLRWWGALDLAYEPKDANARAVMAFRLTPLGASLVRGDDAGSVEAPPDDWGPSVLLTRDHALAAHPLSAGADLLDALTQWARPVSVAGGRLIYTLAPDLACAAFDHGLDPAALGERLAAVDPRAGTRVAEQVMARLSAWRLKYGRTRIHEQVALLEARDEPTLAEALAYAPEIAGHAHRIGPAAALLTPGDLARLRALLARKGYDL